MRPSLKAIIWAPIAISPPLCGRSKRPASLAARLHSTTFVKRKLYQGPKPNRQDLIDLARAAAASFGHAVGTAKIGTGTDAVVDSELRVHGLRGLRVADASVMPSIISGPTNAAAFMIGGRATELIKVAK
jgi:choline dehydrogenase-like flavoprotein